MHFVDGGMEAAVGYEAGEFAGGDRREGVSLGHP